MDSVRRHCRAVGRPARGGSSEPGGAPVIWHAGCRPRLFR